MGKFTLGCASLSARAEKQTALESTRIRSIQAPILILFCIIFIIRSDATNTAGIKFLEENSKKKGVVVLPSGLQYKVLKRGNGRYHPTIKSPCDCHYVGSLVDGTEFDGSLHRGGLPKRFTPDEVIPGWTEALQMMVEGDKWELYIPSELGYGEEGSPSGKVPGGEALIFEIELFKIHGPKVHAIICDPKSLKGCNKQDKQYINTIKQWPEDKKLTELNRLSNLEINLKGNAKVDLLLWIVRRQDILSKLLKVEEL